jgi:hypothetical protein
LAKQSFYEVASQAPGAVSEDLRAEAALRLSLLSTGRTRAVWAERIVEGEIVAPTAIRAEAMNIAAAEAQNRGDLQRAVTVLEASPSLAPGGTKRSHVLKELAGLEFERAKGEGNLPAPESQRPALWQKSRVYAAEVLAMGEKAPVEHRMVAELMVAESYWFQRDEAQALSLALALLERYKDAGRDAAGRRSGGVEEVPINIHESQGNKQAAKDRSALLERRRYLTTAKTLAMQAAAVVGQWEVAENLALDLVANRPEKGEEFRSSDSLMIGLVVLKIVSNERGDTPATAEYGQRAAAHRPDWMGVQDHLIQRQQEFRQRKGSGAAYVPKSNSPSAAIAR